jgi:hypothetical protein
LPPCVVHRVEEGRCQRSPSSPTWSAPERQRRQRSCRRGGCRDGSALSAAVRWRGWYRLPRRCFALPSVSPPGGGVERAWAAAAVSAANSVEVARGCGRLCQAARGGRSAPEYASGAASARRCQATFCNCPPEGVNFSWSRTSVVGFPANLPRRHRSQATRACAWLADQPHTFFWRRPSGAVRRLWLKPVRTRACHLGVRQRGGASHRYREGAAHSHRLEG